MCDCKKLMGGFCEGPTVKCNKEWIAKMIAEFTGTFFFLFFGCLSIGQSSWFNFSAAIALAVHCFAIISGSHNNPSISLAACLMGIITWDAMLLYWLLQFAGALVGFVILAICLPKLQMDARPGLCVGKLSVSIAQGFVVEFCLTFMLILFCCAIWTKPDDELHDSLPIRFLFVFMALVFAGGNYTGAHMNFARSLAPSIWFMDFENFYVYLVSPLLGALVAPLVWKLLWGSEDAGPPEAAENI